MSLTVAFCVRGKKSWDLSRFFVFAADFENVTSVIVFQHIAIPVNRSSQLKSMSLTVAF